MKNHIVSSAIHTLRKTFALATIVACVAVWHGSAFAQTHAKTNSATAKATAPVNVNTADLKALETLPGVGPSTAQKIVDGRPYKSIDDLAKVKGLGKNRADALKDLVTFTMPETTSDTTAPDKKKKSKSTTSASTDSTTPGTSSSAKSTTSSITSTSSTSSNSKKSSPSADRLAPGQKININTATTEDLDKIPGIGPAKAQAIVDYRKENGNFKAIEDIEKVKGIKEGVFTKIKDYLKVSD